MWELVEHPDRESWINGRVASIGSSDAAGILNYGFAGQNPYTIWAQKAQGVDRKWTDEQLELLEIGKIAEEYIARILRIRNKWEVKFDPPHSFRRSTLIPYLTSSLDGYLIEDGEEKVVEMKAVGAQAAFSEWDFKNEEVPLKYSIQVQHQFLVTGLKSGYLVALHGMDTHVFPIQRNEVLIDLMVKTYAKFWKLVSTKTAPPLDSSDESHWVQSRVFKVRPNEVVIANADQAQIFKDYEASKDALARAEETVKQHRASIAEVMGHNEYASLPNGEWFSRKADKNGTRTLRKMTKAPKLTDAA